MKRRQFLATTVGAAGALLARTVSGTSTPCPPPALSANGFGSVSSPCGSAIDAPDWVRNAITNGWQVGTWLQVSGPSPTAGFGLTPTNVLRSVKSVNPAEVQLHGILDSWSGGALATGLGTHGAMIVGIGGGHGTYNGYNDVFAFDLNTRTWREIAPDTYRSNPPTETSAQFGEDAVGAPINNHHAHWPFYDPLRNEYVIPKGWNSSIGGSDSSSVLYGHALNLGAAEYSPSQWTRLDLTPLQLNDATEVVGISQQCGGAWHNGKFWFWAQGGSMGQAIFGSYDSMTRSFTSHSTAWPYNAWQGGVGINAGYAVDPVRNVLVMAFYRGDGRVTNLYNLNAPNTYKLSGYTGWQATDLGTRPPRQTGMGFDWSPALGAFVAWGEVQGAAVYKAIPTTSNPSFVQDQETDYALLWSNMTTNGSVAPVPHQTSNGVFNRFRVAAFGSIDIAFAVTNVDGAVSAYRIT